VSRSLFGTAAALLLATLAGAAALTPAAAAPRTAPVRAATVPRAAPVRTVATPRMRAACPRPRPGYAQCFVMFEPQVAVNAAIAAGVRSQAAEPKGWSPQAIESAYRLPVNRDSHRTVAVSIATNTPHLGHYLAVYRKHYHLPPCTIVKHCLRIVNQRGKASPLPQHGGENNGWSVEATLDVSMISAACPHCHILVVEGNSATFTSLGATEDTAARLGAAVISNSYGTRENGALQPFARSYRHPGHTIVVSSGDAGFTAANFPANLASVTAVGGTALHRAHNARGWRETVWRQPAILGASGSGCSAYVAKPAWQHDPHCPGRTVADVAAVATGVPVYEQRNGGWLTVAGTSISAPLIAGIYGLAGNAAHLKPGDLYRHRGRLFDVTAGGNSLFGTSKAACGSDYLCTAKPGYDAATGLGTPNGAGAF
jgi:subtilase family protein